MLYDIRLLVPWSDHSKPVFCIVLWLTAQRSYYAGADSGFYVRGHPPSKDLFYLFILFLLFVLLIYSSNMIGGG